jgi:clan AA aspartic protease (TIGR02281 family)
MKLTILLSLLLACAASAFADSVPLKREGGTFVVPVLINGKITLDFTIDSGAADVSIPADVFSTMIRAGTVESSDLLDKQVYQLADGSTQTSQRFRIRSLRVGNLELTNVTGAVAPKEGALLLGQSFLTRLKSWSIDNKRRLLIINESPSRDSVSAAPASVGNTTSRASTAPASNWVQVGADDAGTEWFVDASSIRISDGIRRAWTKSVTAPGTGRSVGGKSIEIGLGLSAFNCSEQLWSMEAFHTYYDNGTSDSSGPNFVPLPWQPIPPDTGLRFMLDYVCAWKAR